MDPDFSCKATSDQIFIPVQVVNRALREGTLSKLPVIPTHAHEICNKVIDIQGQGCGMMLAGVSVVPEPATSLTSQFEER